MPAKNGQLPLPGAKAPTIADVRLAMALAASSLIYDRQRQARPGVKWSWSWGPRGIRYSVKIGQESASDALLPIK